MLPRANINTLLQFRFRHARCVRTSTVLGTISGIEAGNKFILRGQCRISALMNLLSVIVVTHDRSIVVAIGLPYICMSHSFIFMFEESFEDKPGSALFSFA